MQHPQNLPPLSPSLSKTPAISFEKATHTAFPDTLVTPAQRRKTDNASTPRPLQRAHVPHHHPDPSLRHPQLLAHLQSNPLAGRRRTFAPSAPKGYLSERATARLPPALTKLASATADTGHLHGLASGRVRKVAHVPML